MQFFSASKIFTGTDWLDQHAIAVDKGSIQSIVPLSETGDSLIRNYEEGLLVPALIDVQVYGASGRLLAEFPDKETLSIMNNVFQKDGTVLFLPTIATNSFEVFKKGIDAVRAYCQEGGKGVFGLHLEGPWLNAEKRGAHVENWIRTPRLEEVKELLDYGTEVIRMITLAPEICNQEIIDMIRSYQVIVSAGHSNAVYDLAIKSFDHGIDAVTHLYNAMSPLHHREPGLVGAAMNHDKVRASIIPDGHHVDYEAIKIAKKIMGPRLFAITDAVTETNSGPYRHELKTDRYECNGVLSGSALSMHKAMLNLVHYAGIELDEAIRMCSLYPAQLLGCDDQYGKIAPGYAGHFMVLNQQLAIADVII